MSDFAKSATNLFQLGSKIARLYTHRVLAAQKAFVDCAQAAAGETLRAASVTQPGNAWQAWATYATDLFQRGVLFWDTIRQRGTSADRQLQVYHETNDLKAVVDDLIKLTMENVPDTPDLTIPPQTTTTASTPTPSSRGSTGQNQRCTSGTSTRTCGAIARR